MFFAKVYYTPILKLLQPVYTKKYMGGGGKISYKRPRPLAGAASVGFGFRRPEKQALFRIELLFTCLNVGGFAAKRQNGTAEAVPFCKHFYLSVRPVGSAL